MSNILSVNQKPIICPKCGSYKIGDIIYGEPLPYFQSHNDNPLIINGGWMPKDKKTKLLEELINHKTENEWIEFKVNNYEP